MAAVICRVFLTDEIRRRMSWRLATWVLSERVEEWRLR
jgi:hypothetical protein